MISMDKQYRTRNGREVRIYAVNGGGEFPIHGAFFDQRKYWLVHHWLKNGKCALYHEHELDLIEVNPRIQREYWVNLYPANHSGGLYESKTRADYNALSDRIACVKITIDCEEGEGL